MVHGDSHSLPMYTSVFEVTQDRCRYTLGIEANVHRCSCRPGPLSTQAQDCRLLHPTVSAAPYLLWSLMQCTRMLPNASLILKALECFLMRVGHGMWSAWALRGPLRVHGGGCSDSGCNKCTTPAGQPRI